MIYLYEDLVGKLDTYKKCKELVDSIDSIGVVCPKHGYVEGLPPIIVSRWDTAFEKWKEIAVEYMSKKRTMHAIKNSRILPRLIESADYRKNIYDTGETTMEQRNMSYFAPIYGILRAGRMGMINSIFQSQYNHTTTIYSPCKFCMELVPQRFMYAFSSGVLTFAVSTAPIDDELCGTYKDNLTILNYL